MTTNPLLFADAVVQRAEGGAHGVLLRVHEPGETAIVLVVATREASGVGLLEEAWTTVRKRDLGTTRAPATSLLGARILGVAKTGVALSVGGVPWVVAPERGRTRVRIGPGRLEAPPACTDMRAALLEEGASLLDALARQSLETARDALLAALDRATKRIQRRATAIEEDLARLEEADAIAAQAKWLVAEAARTPRGARSIAVTDWSTGEARRIEFPLDPSKGAREQVEALFHRARRMKRGAGISRDRLAEARARHASIAAFRDEGLRASTREDLDALATRAQRVAPGDFAVPKAAPKRVRGETPPRRPYRSFLATGDVRILVGRGAEDNDELTLHVARPHDHFLHARGRTGAHVIVVLPKGKSCPSDALVDAAHLAAHFSDARGEPVVEVDHTDRRYVRKPRGSPPGLVVIQREKVIALRVEPARLSRLLAREQLA
jgi:hypothetical protein